ncbi:hypothetical protein B5M09_011869, partial [Aphanomyces astaci]
DVEMHIQSIHELRTNQTAASDALLSKLCDKDASLASLQEKLHVTQVTQTSLLSQAKADFSAKELEWTGQVTELQAKVDVLTNEIHIQTLAHAESEDKIQQLEADVDRWRQEADQNQVELASLRLKKRQIKRTLETKLDEVHATTTHAQDKWNHQVQMQEKARLYQWTRYIAVLTTKLAALRGDLRTCHVTIQQLLEQQQPHIQYLAVQIQAKAATLLQNLHSKYTQQLSDENQKWQQRYDSDLDQLGRQHAHDERDDELEAVKVKMDGHLRNVQFLEKELEFVSNGRAKDVEELKKCHVIDKQLQLDTFQAAIGHVQTQLSDENLRDNAALQEKLLVVEAKAQSLERDSEDQKDQVRTLHDVATKAQLRVEAYKRNGTLYNATIDAMQQHDPTTVHLSQQHRTLSTLVATLVEGDKKTTTAASELAMEASRQKLNSLMGSFRQAQPTRTEVPPWVAHAAKAVQGTPPKLSKANSDSLNAARLALSNYHHVVGGHKRISTGLA